MSQKFLKWITSAMDTAKNGREKRGQMTGWSDKEKL